MTFCWTLHILSCDGRSFSFDPFDPVCSYPTLFVKSPRFPNIHVSKHRSHSCLTKDFCAVGFGKSDKPRGVAYGQELWTWQVQKLIEDVVK